jgi:hypothetical protein
LSRVNKYALLRACGVKRSFGVGGWSGDGLHLTVRQLYCLMLKFYYWKMGTKGFCKAVLNMEENRRIVLCLS